mmetsp:Transcript_26034/g.36626  ORF Transcript_26034/g.36626 Transcript_26034/m.36626 type:complete len:848 (+) Transcript_26034:100-2643(+)
MASTVDKEGWLIKNNQKRHFVLSNEILTWFTHPLGQYKGSLALKDYVVFVRDSEKNKGQKELVLDPLKDKTLKQYRLSSENNNANDLNEWSKALEKVIKYRSLKTDQVDPIKQGWLEKKGQKRWFTLKNGVLYWFNKEQYINADLAKAANGSLEVVDLTVMEGPDQKGKFNFTIYNNRDTYVLSAKTKQEAQDWTSAIKGAIKFKKESLEENKRRLMESMELIPEKRGFLTKKGKKRFFVLKDCVLRWYLDENDLKEKGSFDLADAKVDLDPHRFAIFLTENKGTRSYEVIAQTAQQAEEWFFMLKTSADKAHNKFPDNNTRNRSESAEITTFAEKRGWLIKKGKRRFFILRQDAFVWTQEEPAKGVDYSEDIRGQIALGGCTIEKPINNEFNFSIKLTTTGKEYVLTAKSGIERNEWTDAIEHNLKLLAPAPNGMQKSMSYSTLLTNMNTTQPGNKKGFLVKKGLNRYFLIKEDTLYWYEKENTEKPKGSLHLYNCAINQTGNSCSFTIIPPNREAYTLTAKDDVDCSEWIAALQGGVYTANRLVESGFERTGWLEKKGERRWFVLRKAILMWFDTQVPFDSVTPEKANNHLEITAELVIQASPSEPVFFLENKKSKYELRATTQNECDQWVESLKYAKGVALISPRRGQTVAGQVFGRPLAQLALNPSTKIPVVMEVMVEFLRQNSINTQGVFRLSCDPDRKSVLRASFEKDPASVKLEPKDIDVHCVAALLKALLRELPEPLIQFNLYAPLLKSTRDKAKIKQLLSTLPKINQDCLKYLFGFICKVSENASVNNMTSANLAIVFGPNLLRQQQEDVASVMGDTPYILSLIQVMIEDFKFFFEEP